MTQTLDVAGRFPQRDTARAIEAPAAETQTRSKVGTFAITFGIASTLLYTVFERLNWPLFTYLPRVNRVEFWVYRSPPAESPPASSASRASRSRNLRSPTPPRQA